jgi:hypothetical protein
MELSASFASDATSTVISQVPIDPSLLSDSQLYAERIRKFASEVNIFLTARLNEQQATESGNGDIEVDALLCEDEN